MAMAARHLRRLHSLIIQHHFKNTSVEKKKFGVYNNATPFVLIGSVGILPAQQLESRRFIRNYRLLFLSLNFDLLIIKRYIITVVLTYLQCEKISF